VVGIAGLLGLMGGVTLLVVLPQLTSMFSGLSSGSESASMQLSPFPDK